jgi:hypothetical protein
MQGQNDWITFAPDKDAFQLRVPGEMKYGEKNLLTDIGQIKVITYMYQGAKDDPNFIYLVNYVDYAEGTFSPDSIDLITDFFNISILTNLADLGGELVYKSESPMGPYPGVVYRASYNKGGAVLKGKMVLVNDRFYAIQVYTLSDKGLNGDMDTYLDSFKVKSDR